ncbi:MAG TPA: hypothetical protein VGB59_07750 [Allosphingosinicella sp.]|jgi:tetratricopeptide (TPR) repeat protein
MSAPLRGLFAALLAALYAVVPCEPLAAQVSHAGHSAEAAPTVPQPPRLVTGHGSGGFPVRATADAQPWFDQGMKLMHAYNLQESLKAFAEAQRRDPACAMCFWGEALALGPTVNYEMAPPAHAQAKAALAKAVALASAESSRNRALIEALALRYAFEGTERGPAYRAYAEAMERLAREHQGDGDLAVLAADARMMTDRNWWERDGMTPRAGGAKALGLLEEVLKRNSSQTAAIHLYIHLTERSARPELAEPYVGRLAALAPRASHLVHMASHLYYRLGRYSEAKRVNRRAIAADEDYARRARPEGGLGAMSTFAHNAYFGMSAAILSGDTAAAGELSRYFLAAAPLGERTPGWTYPIYAMAYIASPPAADAAPAVPAPFLKALWRYSRAAAKLSAPDGSGIEAEVQALESLLADPAAPKSGSHRITMELAALELKARSAFSVGRYEEAAQLFAGAADMQDSAPTLDPPLWWYPLRRSLAAAHLAAGRPQAAQAEIEKTLIKWRDDPVSLLILARTQRALGRKSEASAAQKKAVRLWHGGPSLLRRPLI